MPARNFNNEYDLIIKEPVYHGSIRILAKCMFYGEKYVF